MNKTFIITMPDGKTTRTVTGKGRQSACMKATGYRVQRAAALGLIQKIEEQPPPPTRRTP